MRTTSASLLKISRTEFSHRPHESAISLTEKWRSRAPPILLSSIAVAPRPGCITARAAEASPPPLKRCSSEPVRLSTLSIGRPLDWQHSRFSRPISSVSALLVLVLSRHWASIVRLWARLHRLIRSLEQDVAVYADRKSTRLNSSHLGLSY